MPYRVVIQPRVQRQIARWPMPDGFIVDCFTRLQSLRDDPASLLVRVVRPFDGLVLVFELIEPANRFAVHRFAFQVVYGMDEGTIYIIGKRRPRTLSLSESKQGL